MVRKEYAIVTSEFTGTPDVSIIVRESDDYSFGDYKVYQPEVADLETAKEIVEALNETEKKRQTREANSDQYL